MCIVNILVKVRTSPHQRQIHMKVNHIQLDNQLNECLYPGNNIFGCFAEFYLIITFLEIL